MNTKDYLRAAKRELKIESDYALAKKLGLSRSAISRLQSEESQMGAETALKLATILDLPAEIIILDIQKESATNDTMRALWSKIMDKYLREPS